MERPESVKIDYEVVKPEFGGFKEIGDISVLLKPNPYHGWTVLKKGKMKWRMPVSKPFKKMVGFYSFNEFLPKE